MLPEESKLKKILIESGATKERHIKKAEQYSKESARPFLEYLLANKHLKVQDLGQAVADSLGYPYADLTKFPPSKDTVMKVERDVAEDYHAVLVKLTEKTAFVVTDTPDEKRLIPKFESIFPDHDIKVYYSLPDQVSLVLSYYRNILKTEFPTIAMSVEADAVNVFEQMIIDAIKFDTSDVHMEPKDDYVLVRFRVDGQLEEAGRFHLTMYEKVLNLLKIKNGMKTDVHMIAQDGSMIFRHERVKYDIRTSVAPTINGEKVVMRLLASYVKVLSLKELGFTTDYAAILEEAVRKPYGMVIISGPTGSGKTTTLYALLKKLNRASVNVTSIEDPVEYRIPGVNQVQVNYEAKLTFASGLRALVRQDPDIILLGEIRDSETAEIAMNAALTGILVFSTFHAGDSAITIPRLVDMGIEPFILASALELMMSQRLLRKICENCKTEYTMKVSELSDLVTKPERFFEGKTVKLHEGEGCKECNGSGYKGRIAIFESISMSADMKDLTLRRPSAKEVWDLASSQGSRSLFEDGLLKVKEGITTMQELVRVAQPWGD